MIGTGRGESKCRSYGFFTAINSSINSYSKCARRARDAARIPRPPAPRRRDASRASRETRAWSQRARTSAAIETRARRERPRRSGEGPRTAAWGGTGSWARAPGGAARTILECNDECRLASSFADRLETRPAGGKQPVGSPRAGHQVTARINFSSRLDDWMTG